MVTFHDDTSGIRLQQLFKSYGPVPAVRGIDIAIDPGETVALLGPNGAGKSTTIDIILGLVRPDAGSVTLFGQSPTVAVGQGRVGGMLQTGSLIPHLTVRELVTMVASLYPYPMAVEEALQLTATAGFADRRTTKLSGGQTQRVRFALALVANPELLVLDEPTAALDVESRREFWRIMRARGRERQDRAVRHPLPRGGRRLRGPDHPHRLWPGGSRRFVDGDQGGGRWPDHPRHPARCGQERPVSASRGPRRGHTRRRRRPHLPATRRCSAGVSRPVPPARDIEVKGAALEDAFVELTSADIPDSTPDREVSYR